MKTSDSCPRKTVALFVGISCPTSTSIASVWFAEKKNNEFRLLIHEKELCPLISLYFHQKHNFEIDYNFTHLQFTEIDYNISLTLKVSLTQQNEKQTIVADCMCRCHNQFNNLTSPTSDFPIDPSTHNLNSLLLSNNGIFFT